MSDEVVCQECTGVDPYEGSVKGLCHHVIAAHEIEWDDYKERYDVDISELKRRCSRNARVGWKLKRKQMRRNRERRRSTRL